MIAPSGKAYTLPRCKSCDGLLMTGFRCPAPACNDKPNRSELEHAILQDQRQMLADRFVGERVSWKAADRKIETSGYGRKARAYVKYDLPAECGEGIVRDVRVYHGQIFYYFEGRDEGVKRDWIKEWEVVE